MLELSLNAFITLFVVIDPVGVATLFAALTFGEAEAYRRRMALKGTLISATISFAVYAQWRLVTGDFRHQPARVPHRRGALLYARRNNEAWFLAYCWPPSPCNSFSTGCRRASAERSFCRRFSHKLRASLTLLFGGFHAVT